MTRRSGIAVATPVMVLFLLSTPVLVSQSTAQGPTDQEQPTKQEQFEQLHHSVAIISRDYVADVMKTIAFLLLAIGWILTSDRSREFLKNNRAARRAALITVPVVALLHVYLSSRTYKISGAMIRELGKLGYFDATYYAHDEITFPLFAANLSVQLVLFLTLFALIYSLSRPKR